MMSNKFKPAVKPRNDPIRQMAAIRKAAHEKWLEEKQAESGGSQQEAIAAAVTRPFEDPTDATDEASTSTGEKRKADEVESDDDVEFVGQAKTKKAKAAMEEGPRSIFGVPTAMPVRSKLEYTTLTSLTLPLSARSSARRHWKARHLCTKIPHSSTPIDSNSRSSSRFHVFPLQHQQHHQL
jgi:hypothetical protein